MTLAHFSDIHVTHFAFEGKPTLKSFAAIAIYGLAGRPLHFHDSQARTAKLLEDLDAIGVDHAVCTGDLTGVASEAEFQHVARLFGPRLEQPARFTVIPGNHDRYVPQAAGLFERRFADVSEGGKFPFVKHLADGVSLVAIDVSRPDNLIDSSGLCGEAQRHEVLGMLTDASLKGRFVVLALHYALLREDGKRDSVMHRLRDDLELIDLIDRDDVNLDLVLHGHLHRPFLSKTRRRTLVCAGSATDLYQPACGYNVYAIDAAAHAARLERHVWNRTGQRYEAAPQLNRELQTAAQLTR